MDKSAARGTRSFDLLLVWKHGMSQKQQKRFVKGNEKTGEPHNTLTSVYFCPHPFWKFLCDYWLKYVCVTTNITCSALEKLCIAVRESRRTFFFLFFLFFNYFFSFLLLSTHVYFRTRHTALYFIYMHMYTCIHIYIHMFIYMYNHKLCIYIYIYSRK